MDYIKEARRTSNVCKERAVYHGASILRTELGELVDLFRKEEFYGKELRIEDLIEEVGDMFWGVAEMCFGADFRLPSEKHFNKVVCYEPSTCTENLWGIIGSLTKSSISFNNALYNRVIDICLYLDRLIHSYGIRRGTVLDANIAKLKARYPEKFTIDNYDNRDKQKEMEEIKNAITG